MGGKVIDLEVRRIYQEGERSRLRIDAKAMIEDGLEPERVARILKVTEEELAQLTGNAAGNVVGNAAGNAVGNAAGNAVGNAASNAVGNAPM